MQISVARKGSNDIFEPKEVTSAGDLKKYILKVPYSFGVFKDNHRKKDNFIKADFLGLDFDEDVTLAEAEELFKEYMYIIAPTRSHQKEKNGKVCDRFRVILILSSPITDNDTFEATWHSLYEKYPKIDKACKDSSRQFYPSLSIYKINPEGKRVDPVAPAPKPEKKPVDTTTLLSGDRGKLGRDTLELLTVGASNGGRNHAVYKAAKDFQQNLFSFEEAHNIILRALDANGTIASDFQESEVVAAIESAYNREPKHEPRIEPRAYKMVKLGDLYKDKTEIEWVVDSLLSAGGVSLISGDPKAGKSTLVRQLIRDILRGGTFLGRKCKPGMIHYFAIEEQVQVLNSSFKRLGLTEDDNLWVHVGDPLTDNSYQDFHDLLVEQKPSVAIMDTGFDIVNVKSQNDYDEVKRAFRKIRKTARESGTHIIFIHHNGKDNGQFKRQGNGKILGSQAIAGGVDTILVFEVDGRTRRITSSGRQIRTWFRRELIYNEKDNTYTLGAEEEEF